MESLIPLRHLSVFVAVARGASLSEAAASLYMSKSSVSQTLSELEHRLGVSVFERRRGRLVLNEAGRRLLPMADELLGRARAVSKMFSPNVGGILRLGVTESVAAHRLMPIASAFHRRFGWFPQIHVGNTDECLVMLSNYELDLAMVEGIVTLPNMEVIHWREERMIAVAAPTHSCASRKPLTWEALRKVDWLLREPGSGSRVFFESHLRAKLGDDLSVLVLNRHDLVLRAAAAGFGVALVSEGVLDDPHFVDALVKFDLPETFTRRLSIVVRSGKFETEEMRAWRRLAFESTAADASSASDSLQ